MKSTVLFYSDIATGGTSDKEYRVHLLKRDAGFVVQAEFGRRGGTLQMTQKTRGPVSLEEANATFDSVVAEKMRGGYGPANASAKPSLVIAETPGKSPHRIEALEEIKDEREANAILRSPRYFLQTKCNGHFCQIEKRSDGTFVRYNKLGFSVPNIPAEIAIDLKKLRADEFFLAGELIGNRFVTENILSLDGKDLTQNTYAQRFQTLEELILARSRHVTIVSTWRTLAEKLEGSRALYNARCEGMVFKLSSASYREGNSGQHKKYKFTKTLSAIVMRLGDKGHNSATVGLLDDKDSLVEVGKCSLNGKVTPKAGDIIEVKYLHGSEGRRLVQPRMIAIRNDVLRKSCTVDQIIYQGAAA